jgi:metal-sulfur cluster biosynthetic enzyme
MADKDNANPIVYSQSTKQSVRTTDAQHDEWWRDTTLLSDADRPSFRTKGLRAFDEQDSGYGEYDEEDDVHTVELHKKDSDTAAPSKKDLIDSQEIYDLVRSISDPEHPLTLEQLAVVNAEHIVVDQGDPNEHRSAHVLLEFTPTIPHCSMATLIGLALRVRLLRALPARYKVDIRIRPGTHQSENAVNKQLNDKERVAAALENQHLLGVVSDCLATAGRRGASEEEAMRRADELAIELGVMS